jgi:diguanylate cyclase (GGDEF)-like protein
MFMNYKLFDANYHFIGAIGIGQRISNINEMLKRFRYKYNFKVYFVDQRGKVVLTEWNETSIRSINEIKALVPHIDAILTAKETKVIGYNDQGHEYLVNTKYIPELDLHLMVEAKLDDFIDDVYSTFYLNLFISLVVAFGVTVVVLYTVTGYNKRLAFLAQNDVLTGLFNRRAFNDQIAKFHQLLKRNAQPLSLIFFDVDNFKIINDTQGHHSGDDVLKRIGALLHTHLRQTDLVARWGGEEFIVALVDTELNDAKAIAEKLRLAFEEDVTLQQVTHSRVTASFGVTACRSNETFTESIVRVDHAMYTAKQSGKNRVEVV